MFDIMMLFDGLPTIEDGKKERINKINFLIADLKTKDDTFDTRMHLFTIAYKAIEIYSISTEDSDSITKEYSCEITFRTELGIGTYRFEA